MTSGAVAVAMAPRTIGGRLLLTVPALLATSLILAFAAHLPIDTTEASAGPHIRLFGEEAAFVVLVNDYRRANGLGPLVVDRELQISSAWMSNDMGVNAYFSHTDSLGRDPWARMCAYDYDYNSWKGENLAAGYRTAGEVFAGWKASPGHDANMLGPNFVAMGISRVFVAGSPFGWYWASAFTGVQIGEAGQL